MQNEPLVSVVLGTCNRLNFLKLAIDSIRLEVAPFPHEIIVVDGGSTDGTLQWLVNQKDIIAIIQHNTGKWKGEKIKRKSWGYFMNLGFKCAQGKYLCMLSDDCLVVPGAITNGCKIFEKGITDGSPIGAVAFYWRNWPKREKYMIGFAFGKKIFVNHGMYLRKAMEEVGYVDEKNYFFYHADNDVCLKIWQRGYVCVDSPDSYIEHYCNLTSPHKDLIFSSQKKDLDTYLKKWQGIFEDKNEKNKRVWFEKEYQDPFFTARKFQKLHFTKTFHSRWFRLKRQVMSKLKRKFLKQRKRAESICFKNRPFACDKDKHTGGTS